jgi:hypothetical protein
MPLDPPATLQRQTGRYNLNLSFFLFFCGWAGGIPEDGALARLYDKTVCLKGTCGTIGTTAQSVIFIIEL